MFRGGSARPGDDEINRGAAAQFWVFGAERSWHRERGLPACRVQHPAAPFERMSGIRFTRNRRASACSPKTLTRKLENHASAVDAAGCRARQAGSPRSPRLRSHASRRLRAPNPEWRCCAADSSHRMLRDEPIHLGTRLRQRAFAGDQKTLCGACLRSSSSVPRTLRWPFHREALQRRSLATPAEPLRSRPTARLPRPSGGRCRR